MVLYLSLQEKKDGVKTSFPAGGLKLKK